MKTLATDTQELVLIPDTGFEAARLVNFFKCKKLVAAKLIVESVLLTTFSEKDFQELCHDLSSDDACRFRAGCREYQEQLGLEKPIYVTNNGEIWELTSESYAKFLVALSEPGQIQLLEFGTMIGKATVII